MNKNRKIELGRFSFAVPKSQALRIGLGSALTGLGIVGFLPIVGFWMVPAGLMVLSMDVPYARLFRMRMSRWWRKHKEKR